MEELLQEEIGTPLTTPLYDFDCFTRIRDTGGKPFVLRPLVIVDSMRPYPCADAFVFIHTPAAERKKRIRARDRVWGTRVIEKWRLHQVTLRDVLRLQYPIDLQLDGMESIDVNVEKVLSLLEQKGLKATQNG